MKLKIKTSLIFSNSFLYKAKIHLSVPVSEGLPLIGVFTGRQRSCKPCTSYRREAVRPSVCLSICLSVCPSHAGTE